MWSSAPGGITTQTETCGQTHSPPVCHSPWYVGPNPCSTLKSLATVPHGICEAMVVLNGLQGQLAGGMARPQVSRARLAVRKGNAECAASAGAKPPRAAQAELCDMQV